MIRGDYLVPMTLTNSIAHAIETIIRDEFADVRIEQVRVTEELDYQEDRVFKVTVIFDKKGALDPRKTAAIVRHLQRELSAKGEQIPFPILSFVSKSDAARIGSEAA